MADKFSDEAARGPRDDLRGYNLEYDTVTEIMVKFLALATAAEAAAKAALARATAAEAALEQMRNLDELNELDHILYNGDQDVSHC
tara:strand:+ start:179 stop:436 length:258 start_codon:yes stop_codon:yes gene_type:complete